MTAVSLTADRVREGDVLVALPAGHPGHVHPNEVVGLVVAGRLGRNVTIRTTGDDGIDRLYNLMPGDRVEVDRDADVVELHPLVAPVAQTLFDPGAPT